MNEQTRDSVALARSRLLPDTIVKICGWRHDSISTIRHGFQLQQLRLEIDDIVFCMEHFKGLELSVSQRCATPTLKQADITLVNIILNFIKFVNTIYACNNDNINNSFYNY